MSGSTHKTYKPQDSGRKNTSEAEDRPPYGPPYGWYYFGPEPPWNTAATSRSASSESMEKDQSEQKVEDNSDLMQAFDRLSRGEVNAETIGKLFDLKDRDFWKGALAGAAAALTANNMPMLKAMAANVLANVMAQATASKPAAPKAKAEPPTETAADMERHEASVSQAQAKNPAKDRARQEEEMSS